MAMSNTTPRFDVPLRITPASELITVDDKRDYLYWLRGHPSIAGDHLSLCLMRELLDVASDDLVIDGGWHGVNRDEYGEFGLAVNLCLRQSKVLTAVQWLSYAGFIAMESTYAPSCTLTIPANYTRKNHPATRRAARRSTSYASPRRRLAIFQRDGWQCQLCGDAVGPDVDLDAVPYVRWPSLDHIVPVSTTAAPDDSSENLRLVHAGCNAIRGNRSYIRQLLPISDREDEDETAWWEPHLPPYEKSSIRG